MGVKKGRKIAEPFEFNNGKDTNEKKVKTKKIPSSSIILSFLRLFYPSIVLKMEPFRF